VSEIHEQLELTNMNYTNGVGWQITAVIGIAPTIYQETNSIECTKDRAFKLLERIKEIVDEAAEEEKKNSFDFEEIVGFKKDYILYPSPKIKSVRYDTGLPTYTFESMRRFVELGKKKEAVK